MKILYNIIILLIFNFTYSQTNMEKYEIKTLSEAEGFELIQKEAFTKCNDFKESTEYDYFDGKEKGYLVHNKFLKTIHYFSSKKEYEKFEEEFNEPIEYPQIDFESFQEKTPARIERLSQFLNLHLSENDKISDLQNVDEKVKEMGHLRSSYINEFMDFFTYFYITLRNELNYKDFEIKNTGEDYEFYISNGKEKKEIFSDFYLLMIDDDNLRSMFETAKFIKKPFVIPIGNINDVHGGTDL